MKIIDCPREQDVMKTVAPEQWPDGYTDELHAHIAACAICTDVLEVARAIHEDCEAAENNAQVPQIPPAGLVWWRAEIRARQEAMRAASRPMTLVQAFGAASGIGVALNFARSTQTTVMCPIARRSAVSSSRTSKSKRTVFSPLN